MQAIKVMTLKILVSMHDNRVLNVLQVKPVVMIYRLTLVRWNYFGVNDDL